MKAQYSQAFIAPKNVSTASEGKNRAEISIEDGETTRTPSRIKRWFSKVSNFFKSTRKESSVSTGELNNSLAVTEYVD